MPFLVTKNTVKHEESKHKDKDKDNLEKKQIFATQIK